MTASATTLSDTCEIGTIDINARPPFGNADDTEGDQRRPQVELHLRPESEPAEPASALASSMLVVNKGFETNFQQYN